MKFYNEFRLGGRLEMNTKWLSNGETRLGGLQETQSTIEQKLKSQN
jgi:hypothetical protein